LSYPTVQSIGEQGLLRIVQRFCPAAVVGDDAAVLALPPSDSLVVTTDVFVDGVHFASGLMKETTQTMTAADVGWRAAAANLSDLAAMGAAPLGLTVGLGLPGTTPVHWVEQLYEGLTHCLNHYNTVILGGDLCRAPVMTLGITALGQVNPEQVIRRSAARPGDVVLVSGAHGAARAGLELLLNPDWGRDLEPSDRAALIQAHQRPRPRLEIPPLLRALNSQGRVAGMDSSDGLADAVLQICGASGVGARLDRSRLPIPDALLKTRSCDPETAVNWTLYGGEDFELVLCLPPTDAEALAKQLNHAAIIGEIIAGSEVQLLDPRGTVPPQQLTLEQGFQHF